MYCCFNPLYVSLSVVVVNGLFRIIFTRNGRLIQNTYLDSFTALFMNNKLIYCNCIHGTDLNGSLQARLADITLIEEPAQPSTMGPSAMDQLLVSILYCW